MLLILVVVFLFAAWVTTHVWLSGTLLRRPPRWRAALALIVPPLAPFWSWREGRRRSAVAWSIAALSYTVALVAAAVRGF